MDFKRDDFIKMMFSVYDLQNTVSFTKAFPSLTIYPEFHPELRNLEPLKMTQVMRFICFAYDKNCPLMGIEDVKKRKAYALDLAGYERLNGGKWPRRVEALIHNSYPSVNAMIIRFLRVQNSVDYAAIKVYEEKFFDTLIQLFDVEEKDADAKDKDLFALSESLRTKIRDLKDEFMLGDTNENLSQAFFDELENDQLGLSPEEIAMKMGEGKMDSIWKVLSEDYIYIQKHDEYKPKTD